MEKKEEFLKNRTIEITQSEQERENRLKKMSRSSRTCGAIRKDLTLMSSESQKERKEQC